MKTLNVQLLLTGNELMTGDIIDTNSVMMAKSFQDIGFDVTRKVTVADSLSLLINEVIEMSKDADVLIINGGLGPTTDDLTSEALASALDCSLAQNKDALTHLENWADVKNKVLSNANLKQAILPIESTIINNRTGSAVGIKATLNQCEIYCTPGVPSELNIMFREEVLPDIKERFASDLYTHTTRLHIFGYGESNLQECITKAFPNWPSEVVIGFRADTPSLELKLTTYDKAHLALKTQCLENITTLLGDHIIEEIASKPKTLAELLIEQLKEKNLTITTAESCTGGLISSQLTAISGSSQVFEAGFVTYSNAMKTKLLNVNESTLEKFGAVSEETVIEMAKGALLVAEADNVIAVSGVAGPTGGSEEKPVGTVWIAWGNNSTIHTHCFQISGTRAYVQKAATARSLDLVRRLLINSEQSPIYLN